MKPPPGGLSDADPPVEGQQSPIEEQTRAGPASPEPPASPTEPVGASEQTPTSQQTPTGGKAPTGGRLRAAVALSIAAVTVLGALVGWKVETHASAASEWDQDAVAASIRRSATQVDARAQAGTAEVAFQRLLALQNEADRLSPSKGCSAGPVGTVDEADAAVACSLQTIFGAAYDPHYVDPAGYTYDSTAFASDVAADSRYFVDQDPAPYTALARSERSKEDKLLWLTIAFIAALGCLTFAQLLHHDRIRTLRMAIPGWVILLAGAVLFVAWEF